jgi:hypothetical protein
MNLSFVHIPKMKLIMHIFELINEYIVADESHLNLNKIFPPC